MHATTDAALMPAITQKPSAKPPVAACADECPDASSVFVCVNATVAAIATPIAPPTCCAALISPDASPASCGSTPASAAIDIGVNENAMPTPTIRYPGRRCVTNEPSTGICVYHSIPPVISARPTAPTAPGP